MIETDNSSSLTEQVQEAVRTGSPLRIVGGDSKAHLGDGDGHQPHAVLSLAEHQGIIAYEPTELVISVRTGTPLSALNDTLDAAGQMLPFDPPQLPSSTIGGVLACGLSGPRRPFNGAARDYVLGTRIINGQAQNLSFGGEVMKNVAGYDVSRVQVGAWGTLGVLLDVSMKVLPKPELEITLVQQSKAGDTGAFASFLRKPLPLSGAMLIGDQRYFRLSGSASAVKSAAQMIGGETVDDSDRIWCAVRDQTHPFFHLEDDGEKTLWRISVADHAPAIELPGIFLYEWAGAQRWLISQAPADEIFQAAANAGGHAMRYTAKNSPGSAFQPLSGAMLKLQSRLRDSFDPQRLFNRGRFHPEMDH